MLDIQRAHVVSDLRFCLSMIHFLEIAVPTLEFKGKQHIYAHHLTVPYHPLVPDWGKSTGVSTDILPPPNFSSNVETSSSPAITAPPDGNLIIHADNLKALKALLPRYAGRVKCIYIDPPYNTGNKDWAYNDNVNSPLMREWLNQNKPVDGEDLERHDKWLCMMWPRLHLLRELLADDGVIFVSIDDHEQPRLRLLMDEIFGEENFITQVTWHKKRGKDNSARFFSVVHDFVVLYAKNKQATTIRRLPMDKSTQKAYKNPDNDPRGPYRLLGVWSRQQGGSSFAFTAKSAKFFSERLWLVNETTMQKLDFDNRLVLRGDKIYRKLFINEVNGSIPETVWTGLSNYANAKDEIKAIFKDAVFDTPKPLDLIDRVLRIATNTNDIILDSFAGSGTTAHAVLALNKADGGNRRFILVECEDYADSITAERVRRVINGVPNAKNAQLQEGLGGSFTYCTLGGPITVDGLLAGQSMPDYPTLAAYLLHTAAGISAGETDFAQQNDGLFYRNGQTDYYLLYQPDLEYVQSQDAVLNESRAKGIGKRNQAEDRRAVVFAAGKYIGQRELTGMGITFCQLPYGMYRAG